MNQIKLTDVINPEQSSYNQKSLRHILHNSLRRNIITETALTDFNHQYQIKINNKNFSSQDLHLLFMHLYSKQSMSVSDRNLIRRLLLTIFPEKMIWSAGKNLIYNIQYKNYFKDSKIVNKNQFFLVLKGTLEISSPYYHRQVETGMFFGHLQLLGNEGSQNMSIICKSAKCSLLIVESQRFNKLFRRYFEKQVQDKTKALPHFFRKELTKFQQIQLYQEMDKISFPVATKIFNKGQVIEKLIFISQGKVNYENQNEKLRETLGSIIGFSQYSNGIDYYSQNYITSDNIQGYSISLSDYKRIIDKDRFLSLFSQIQGDFSRLKSESLGKSQKKEECLKKSFLRVRKVKLPVRARMKTTASLIDKKSDISMNSTAFYFIKPEANLKARKQNNNTSLMNEKSNLESTKIQYSKSALTYFI